jgi:glycosyltransferase involved in cell wall biosynthesis
VVFVSRAEDQRQEEHDGIRLNRVFLRNASCGVSVVHFDVEVRKVDSQGHPMAHPFVGINLHVSGVDAKGQDGFEQVIEAFLQSPEFAVGAARALGSHKSRQDFSALIAVQSQRVLDTPSWDLPLGNNGAPLDRSDLVFHVPLGSGPEHLRWVTLTTNLLAKHVAAYQGKAAHRQSFLCFSQYTRSVALAMDAPADRICQFPVALPPGRVIPVERSADMETERIAWIGPADAQEKGLHHLVETLEIVNQKLSEQGRHVTLDVYGRLPARGSNPAFDAHYDANYRPLVERGDLEFHGFLPDAERSLKLAQRDRITVNASEPTNEGLGMASLEAVIAAGVGYATRPGGGAEDAAAYVDRAFVATSDTREALAGAIVSALDHERELLQHGGRSARHSTRSGMLSTFPQVANVIERFIAGVARSKPSHPGHGQPEPTVG